MLNNPYQSSVSKNSAVGQNRNKSLPSGGYKYSGIGGGIGGGIGSGIGGAAESYGSSHDPG